MAVIKNIAWSETADECVGVLRERGYAPNDSACIRKAVQEIAEKLTKPKKRMNRRMQLEAEEAGYEL